MIFDFGLLLLAPIFAETASNAFWTTAERLDIARQLQPFGIYSSSSVQILKHGVFFVRARAIGEEELLAQAQCLSFHCSGIKPVPDRTQELISVQLTFSRVPCVTKRSRIELIERYFRSQLTSRPYP